MELTRPSISFANAAIVLISSFLFKNKKVQKWKMGNFKARALLILKIRQELQAVDNLLVPAWRWWLLRGLVVEEKRRWWPLFLFLVCTPKKINTSFLLVLSTFPIFFTFYTFISMHSLHRQWGRGVLPCGQFTRERGIIEHILITIIQLGV